MVVVAKKKIGPKFGTEKVLKRSALGHVFFSQDFCSLGGLISGLPRDSVQHPARGVGGMAHIPVLWESSMVNRKKTS